MNSYVTTVTLHANTTKIGTAFAYMNLLTTINLSGTKLSEIVTNAFKTYTLRKERNIPLLSEYARQLRVEEKLRSYLEVLL